LPQKFAKGAYFGFTWYVETLMNSQWNISLIDSLCDTARRPAYNTEKWITGPNPSKSYFDAEVNLTVSVEYNGDGNLTLWKPGAQVVTYEITDITHTSATGGGNVQSDGGFPVTARGVCWSASSNPTTSDSHTSNGSGIGSFTSQLTNLTPNIPYYVRAYATNIAGKVYGNEVLFTSTNGHYIGENFKGGIIFYLDGTKQHGLIAAASDQSTGAIWGCDMLVGTATAIGTGQNNTNSIINTCPEAGSAARICHNLSLKGYNDWFLPSKDEMYQMYQQKSVIGGFDLVNGYYWTSSESDTYSAWVQYILDGTVSPATKLLPFEVRAIRAF